MREIPENLCIIPFIHFSTKPNGAARLCCASTHLTSNEKGEQLFLGTHSFEEIWNGSDMRSIRHEMLEGKKLTVCKQCWDEEKAGKISKRMRENKRYLISNEEKLVKAKDGGYVFENPFYLDLRMGNLCNLKCRTCNPQFSSAWQAEIKSIMNKNANDSILNTLSGGYLKESFFIAEKRRKWYQNEDTIEEIKKLSQDLRVIYFTGGEPLLIKEVEELMDYFLETGNSNHIGLHFNSNVTLLKPSFVEKMSRFSEVKFGASVDAYGKRNNWLRFPSDFLPIKKNMEKLVEESKLNNNIHLHIHCTISVYNILYMKEVIDWSRELSNIPPHVSFNLLYGPEFQHISVLTKNLKQKAIDNLDKIRKTYNLYDVERNGIESCLAILNNSLEDDEKIVNLRRQLKDHTFAIDRWRKENFFSVFPEFKGELV